jgi:diguanylate cyclase (GGDEF)-like protein/PAS domain S-box-containing protein
MDHAAPDWSVHGLVDLPMYFWDGVLVVLAILSLVLLFLFFCGRRTARNLERTSALLTEAAAERDAALRVVEERESLFRHLFDQAQVGIFRSTLAGDRFLVANRALVRMYGYESIDLFLQAVRPSDLYDYPEQRAEAVRMLQEHGQITNFELSFNRADGSRGAVLTSMYLRSAEGWIEGSVLDITELRMAHAEVERQHGFLQTLLNAIPNPIFYKDAAGVYRLVNEAFARMLGKPESELIGKSVHDIAPPDLARTYEEMDNVLLQAQGQSTQRYDSQVESEQGLRSVVFFKESVLDATGAILGLVGTISDVTLLREKERDLRIATARYRNILDNAVEGIAEFSAQGEFLDVNPALARMLGYMTPSEVLEDARKKPFKFYVDPLQREAMVELVRAHGHVQRFEIQVRRRDGGSSWLSLSLNGVMDEAGGLMRMHGLALDVTIQKREHDELARMASTDILTGLANRAAMLAQLDRMLIQAKARGLVLGVLFMDLDGFKDINDQWGHQAGDLVLIQVAERIRLRLRGSDVLARMGGDEFAILLWDLGAERNLHTVAKAVVRDMQVPFECLGVFCNLGASLGGSLFPEHAASSSDLLALADQAMYRVKRQGKNGFCVHGRDPVLFEAD